MNAAAHALLDAEMEAHKAILGDSEDVLNSAMDAKTEAVDTHLDAINDNSRCSRAAGIVAGTAARTRYGRRPGRRYHNLGYRRLGRHTSEVRLANVGLV